MRKRGSRRTSRFPAMTTFSARSGGISMPRASRNPTIRFLAKYLTCWASRSVRSKPKLRAERSHMREDRFRKAAKERRTLFNAWLTLCHPFLIEQLGEAGFDCITIDQQHGLGGNEALLSCLIAARAVGLPAIVRVAENDFGLIGRALDAGAQAIMCPMIETVEDAEIFVKAVKYPPRGLRSWGPYRARLDHEGDYFTTANSWTIACPQIETRGALDQLEEILALEGVDMVWLGAHDLSVALTGRLDLSAKEVKEAMTLVLSKCREMSVMSLIFANDVDFAKPRVE